MAVSVPKSDQKPFRFDEESLQIAFKRSERDRRDLIETNKHLIDRSLLLAGFAVTVTSTLVGSANNFESAITVASLIALAVPTIALSICLAKSLAVASTFLPTPGFNQLWEDVLVKPRQEALIVMLQEENKSLREEMTVNGNRAFWLRWMTIAMFAQVTLAMSVLVSSKMSESEISKKTVDNKTSVSQIP